jgi:hypothetical protein
MDLEFNRQLTLILGVEYRPTRNDGLTRLELYCSDSNNVQTAISNHESKGKEMYRLLYHLTCTQRGR